MKSVLSQEMHHIVKVLLYDYIGCDQAECVG